MRPAHPVARWLLLTAVSLGAASVPLIVLFVRSSGRFFFLDDKQAQYAAAYHYIGNELTQGHLPVLVPWMGTSANLLLDPQYGLLNPVFWVQNIAFAQFSDLAIGSFAMAVGYLVLLAAGAVAWLVRLNARGWWPAVGGFAAAFSGYLVWWVGPSWHPGLASVAFLPWIGWALSARRPGAWNALALTAATFACLAAGWPFTAISAGALVVSNIVESFIRDRRRDALVVALATAAGAALAAPTVLFTASALDWTVRQGSVSNDAFLVPNLADVLNTAMATAGANINSFGKTVVTVPIMLAGGLTLALIPLLAVPTRWWRVRGAITLTGTLLALLVLTQSPSAVGPLRWPFRYLGPWQVVVAVALVAALAVWGVRITRARVAVSAGLLLAAAYVTVSRTPQDLLTHVVSLVVVSATVLLLVLVREALRALVILAGGVLILVWASVVHPANVDLPDWGMPTEVASYQQPLGAGAERSLVLYPAFIDYGAAAAEGVYLGQNYLLSPARSGLGYTSVGQRQLVADMCTATHGWTCPAAVDFLASTEPTTGQVWAALLGADTIVAHNFFVPALQEKLPQWVVAQTSGDFTVLKLADGSDQPGRVTYSPPGMQIEGLDVGELTQTYQVDSSAGGTIAFADVYWPGYEATFNGQPIPVTPLADALVSVTLPARSGTLEIVYHPAGLGPSLVSSVVGLLLAAAAAVVAARMRRTGLSPSADTLDEMPQGAGA